MDLSAMKDLYIGSTPVQSAWLGGPKVWERKPPVDVQAIKDAMLLWYDLKRQGATNESMTANPKLIDLSGNRHDATCYNFAWNVQSGIDDGQVTFEDFGVSNGGTIMTHTLNVPSGQGILKSYSSFTKNINSFIVRISNYASGALTSIMYYYRGSDGIENAIVIQKDGTYVMPVNYTTVDGGGTYAGFAFPYKSEYDPNTDNPPTVTLEILPPTYPNALVADGVDDYTKVEGLPLLTDYTVIMKREGISIDTEGVTAVKGYTGMGILDNPFAIDIFNNVSTYIYGSFGRQESLDNTLFTDTKIIEAVPYKINGREIYHEDDANQDAWPYLYLCGEPSHTRYNNIALYSFILFNRTLTEEEINWVKTNLIEGDTEL